MEPFELKLHQVTFDESEGGAVGDRTQHLDSCSDLVHYDGNFRHKPASQLGHDGASLRDLTFQKSGSRVSPPPPAQRTSAQTTTTPSCSPSPIFSTGTVSSPGAWSPRPSVSSEAWSPRPAVSSVAPPWEVQYAGDAESQEHFLVNADDYFGSPSRHQGKVSPESAAAGLRTLSQVSVNTAAVARHLRQSQGGKGKRRVAKTTLTTTALTSPCTMPSETSAQPSSAPSLPTPLAPPPGEEGAGGGVNDSSFETVAEALRLQWSVIGNSSVTPASPEEVARIVAEAGNRLRLGGGGVAPQDVSVDANASDLHSVGSLSSLSSLSSFNDTGVSNSDAASLNVGRGSTINDTGVSANSPSTGGGGLAGPQATPFIPGGLNSGGEGGGVVAGAEGGGGGVQSGLIRIPAQSITREVGKAGWFQSKDKQGAPPPPSSSSHRLSPPGSASPRRVASSGSLSAEGAGELPRQPSSSNLTMHETGSDPAPQPGISPMEPGPSVREGTAVSSQDLNLNLKSLPGETAGLFPRPSHSMGGETQHADHRPQTSAGAQTQLASATSHHHQISATSHHQPPPPSSSWQQMAPPLHPPQQGGSDSLPLSSSTTSTPSYSADHHHHHHHSPIPSPSLQQQPQLPLFDPSLAPIPHVGPLFPPKKAGGVGGPWSARGDAGQVSESWIQGALQKDGFQQLLKDKLKLEGQLEVLQEEAQGTLQERATLQAQLTSLQLKVKVGQQRGEDPEKAGLVAELERLRATRMDHEREALEVQQMLEEKLEELKAVTEDLYQSQDTTDKLQVRMKEVRDDLQARDITVQALKAKIAELYVEVQTTLQNKMEADGEARTARNDLVSLVKAKEWYQEQLSTAHEVRAKLQRQLTTLQAQTVSQGSIVERLKLESGRLRQQLRESQERALRDKEQLARHLEAIQTDMMEREAAFQEIQRERLLIEDTFNTQVTSVEEEKSRLDNLLKLISELESQLELAHANSKKKQEMVFSLENQQMDLMKKMTLSQEVLIEKEQLLEEASQKLIEVESQLEAFTRTLAGKDAELMQMREDKAATEIALKGALQEKESVDRALDMLKGDMGKVEKSFKQMRQELGTRSVELEQAQSQQKDARDQLDRVAHDLDIKARSLETLTHDFQEQTTAVQRLQSEKESLKEQTLALQRQLEEAQSSRPADDASQHALQTELTETRARLAETESRLQVSSTQLLQSAATAASPPQSEASAAAWEDKLQEVTLEKDSLRQQLESELEEKSRRLVDGRREAESLGQEVTTLRSQLSEARIEFERTLAGRVDELRGVTEEKQRLETELEMTRRTFELSSVQQQEHINIEIQSLMKEVEAARLHEQELERALTAMQTDKDAEIAGLRRTLADTQHALQDREREQQQRNSAEEFNQQLALDLEKERGRIAGLQQSNATLKDHMRQLEEVLAGRESSLEQLQLHLEGSGRDRQTEQQQYLRRIQELELALTKAKDSGRDLRKQIGSKITENKRLSKQHAAHTAERAALTEEVDRSVAHATALQSELEAARQAVRHHQGELQALQGDKQALEARLEAVKRELVDNADRNPVLLEQIQNLEWQVHQRGQEVTAAAQQLALAEQRHTNELESLQRALQAKQDEVETLQGELAAVKQEKLDQKSRVSELRSVLKASVQHHKLTKKLNRPKKEKGGEGGGGGDADESREEKGTQADMGNGVVIPPLPFELEAVEQLLLDTAVKPLDSKPLENLSTCLSSLRAEISGLQKQMEVHTTTIHTSTQSWRSVESEVKGLQEVVRCIANTIMDANHTTSTATTTSATDLETVDESGVLHL